MSARWHLERAALTLGTVALAASVGAQSLGDVARRERDKRDKAQACAKPEAKPDAKTKTYTDEDLAALREARPDLAFSAIESPAGEETAKTNEAAKSNEAVSPVPGGSKKAEEGAKSFGRTEAYWRDRLTPYDSAVRRARREVARVAGSG